MDKEMLQHGPAIIVSDYMFQGIVGKSCIRDIDVVWDSFGKRPGKYYTGLIEFFTSWN